MRTDIALFLRDPVPDTRLLPALASVFGTAVEGDLRVVDYEEGFATGIGMTQVLQQPVQAAVQRLARMLDTEVLLEACTTGIEGPVWLLFVPDRLDVQQVNVVEMRYGLDVVLDRLPGALSRLAEIAPARTSLELAFGDRPEL